MLDRRPTLVPPGTPAPDFTLRTTPDQAVSLRDFRGQPVILAFYPADWSPVCSDQMSLYNTSERALFVIDEDGVVRWRSVSLVGINPGADGILAALERLQATGVSA